MIINSYFNTQLKKMSIPWKPVPPKSHTAADADFPTKHHANSLINCLSILSFKYVNPDDSGCFINLISTFFFLIFSTGTPCANHTPYHQVDRRYLVLEGNR